MILTNISKASRGFEILQTTGRAQTAMMTLKPGEASGGKPHPESDQVLLVLEGEAVAEIGDEKRTMVAGNVVIVPAGIKHQFSNHGTVPVITFNVYSPPAYPPHTRE